MNKRIIQLELNELSKALLDKAITQHDLPHFKRLLSDYTYVTTHSEDQYEHIEPWIVWINAHTGKNYAEHGVFHLSDSERLQFPQIWETLGEKGISSLILGCMNGHRGKCQNGIFFPDPWSKTGEAFPENLQGLWRFVSEKVQTHATQRLHLSDLYQGVLTCLRYRVPPTFYLKVAAQLIRQKISPKQRWRMAALFDELLGHIFLHLLKRGEQQYNVLFLNAIAHYQHHYWRLFDKQPFAREVVCPDARAQDNPILYGLRQYDRLLGRLFAYLDTQQDTLLMITTGFAQEPFTQCEAQGGMNYYRLNDHHAFINALGIQHCQVYPLMSRDWQIRCAPEQIDAVKQRLSDLRVAGDALFKLKQTAADTLFIETAITRAVAPEATLNDGQGLRFHDLFTCTAVKSGHHISEGSLWVSTTLPQLREAMPITELYSLTLESFNG